ncbi:T9SS type A sorting domain-containing protein, partial [Flavobacterium lindanitolerans]|uniref:T9SS type A sorting domain-containing protein n=1 Tax=Flavobacterium lindanitolerans TaxID=428988 RepID=UPI0031A721A6
TTINLAGLIPESTSSISYTINNGNAQNVAGIIADISGNASFTISLPYSNNGHSLVIGTIERTDISSCPNALTANNSVVLAVNPSPTVTAVSTTPLCATNGNAVISLTGLIANSTSEITYTIAGGTAVTVSGITANASGEADFEVAVSTAENGRTLDITSIKRTDVTPDCESVISGISTILVINSRPTAVISGDQSVCQGSASSELNITLTGTAPWTITYTDGTSTFPITNIQTSPYTFTVTANETKTYTVTAVEDANCIAQAADMSGSATITVIETGNGGTITGNSTVCFGTNNGTLTLENHVGTIIKWQSSTVADFSGTVTDIENTAATLNYTNLSETAYYRAVVQNAPCTEIYSTIATITVNQTEAPTTAPQTFCNAATVADLQPNTAGIQWYDAPNGGNALSLTQPLTNGDYYATMTVHGCESARTLTSVTINTVTPPTTTAHAFCNTATVADLQPNTAGIKWYDTPNGGTALSLTQPLTNGDYYATMTVDGCESARTLTSVTINMVAAPNGSENQNFTEGETLADLEVTGTNLEWYATETAAEAGTPVLDSNELLVDGATYYAVQTIGECSSSPLAVTVSIVLGNPEFDLTMLKAYPNPVTDLLNVSYSENILAVEVFNLIGQKIMDKTVNNTLVSINLSDIETGTYLVRVSSGKAQKTFRILKK